MKIQWLAASVVALAAPVLGAACTVTPDGGAGVLACSYNDAACYDDTECCSGYCDPGTATCVVDALDPGCATDNSGCAADSDCCSGVCGSDGFCGLAVCDSSGAGCAYDSECCQGEYCTSTGDCGTCEVAGGSCAYDLDCCSDLCDGGVCAG